MKLFNITDVPTSALQAQGLVNVSVKVGSTVIPPGQSREISGTARELSELSIYVRNNALARDALPAAYANAKGLNTDGTPREKPKPEPEPETPPTPEVVEVREESSEAGGSRRRR